LSAASPTDFDGESRWDHPTHSNTVSIVDIGADEFIDTDLDELPDHWEVDFFGGLLVACATNDTDQDELADSVEYQNATAPDNPDTDGDQVSDGWEILYGFNPRLNDSTGDPDGDGFITAMEYLADTNPTNGFDYFCLINSSISESRGVFLVWRASSNRLYAIQSAADVTGPWSFVTNVSGHETEAEFSIYGETTPTAFFRVKARLK
jgi:hypothetical protein